jgi:hypothetical protein
MTTSPAELLADAAATGREVDLACDACEEAWTIFVREGEEYPTYEQTLCPAAGCSGEGEEV